MAAETGRRRLFAKISAFQPRATTTIHALRTGATARVATTIRSIATTETRAPMIIAMEMEIASTIILVIRRPISHGRAAAATPPRISPINLLVFHGFRVGIGRSATAIRHTNKIQTTLFQGMEATMFA